MLKKTIIAAVFIILIGAIFFYKQYNKPHKDIIKAKPDISLDSEFLKKEFTDDEATANTKYLDQLIAVKGTIVKIETERGNTIISLGNTEDLFGNIRCHMLENTKEQQNLKTGQVVTIKGVCTGFLLDVILVRSVLL